jgi:tRNA(fMet)-specific endonuclease VapC
MKNVLIDTNIYSLAMKGDAIVVDALRKIDHIGFSVIRYRRTLFRIQGRQS